MAIKDSLLPEYDHEAATTRRLLERVPEADFAWKPHEKSFSLGQLAFHIANIPTWGLNILDRTSFDLAERGDDARPKDPTTHRDLLAQFDANIASARARIVERTDPEMLVPWSLQRGSQEMFTLPRISALRSFVMNHMIHHRGQLSVYLRLRNVALPPIYGPTADEGF